MIGVPGCISGLFCKIVAYGASFFAYYGITQLNSVQAAYWHDPVNQAVYQKFNLFLADINQERVTQATFYFIYIKFIWIWKITVLIDLII